MRILTQVVAVLLGMVLGIATATAQQVLPEQRFNYTNDADFCGADLGPLFDTSRGACARACAAQNACAAFTFNTPSDACFPKFAMTEE